MLFLWHFPLLPPWGMVSLEVPNTRSPAFMAAGWVVMEIHCLVRITQFILINSPVYSRGDLMLLRVRSGNRLCPLHLLEVVGEMLLYVRFFNAISLSLLYFCIWLWKNSLMCLGLLDVVLFPLKFELIFLKCAFYLFVNNVIWEVIVNEGSVNIFKFWVEDCFGGGYEFGMIY